MANTNAATYVVETLDKVLIRIVKANDWIFNKDKRYTFNEETKANLWQQISAQLAEEGFQLTDKFSFSSWNYGRINILCCSWSHKMEYPKTRWKKLRDLFVRHDKNGNRKWIYFEDMSFMLDHIRHNAKPPARIRQLPVSYSIGNLNSSSNSTMHLGVQNQGDEAYSLRPFLQKTPVLVDSTSTHPVDNEVRSPDVAEIARPSNSSCGSSGFNIQQDHSAAISDTGVFQSMEYVQPMFYEVDFPIDFEFQTTNDIEISSSNPTVGTSSQNMSWEQSSASSEISATSKTLTVNSLVQPDCTIVEDSTCQSRNLTQSPVRTPSRSSVVESERTPPMNTGTKLKKNSTSITSHGDKLSQNSLSRLSFANKNSSPLAATLISDVRATDSTKRVSEPSREPIHLVKKNPKKTGEKRPMVVPPLDAFAQKKRKAVSKSEATEDAIIECSNGLKQMSSEFKDLLRLKKELIKVRLQEGTVETETTEKSSTVESKDGFFNLLQKEWLDLPAAIQDQLFPDILDIMEEFEVM